MDDSYGSQEAFYMGDNKSVNLGGGFGPRLVRKILEAMEKFLWVKHSIQYWKLAGRRRTLKIHFVQL
jgi:hypothetical protein